MASTLKITVSEDLNINGTSYSSSHTKIIQTITSVYKHVYTATTTSSTLLNFADDHGDVGTLDRDTIEYFRITNLDSTNFVILGFEKESSTASGYWVKLDAGKSFIVPTPNVTTEHPQLAAHDSAHAVPSFVDIESVTADADTASCKLEVMIAMNG